MKALAPLLVTLAIAPPVAWGTQAWVGAQDAHGDGHQTSGNDRETPELSEARARIDAQLSALDQRLSALARAAEVRARGGERRSLGGLEDAIAQALAQHGLHIDAGARGRVEANRSAARAELFARVDTILAGDDPLAFAQSWRQLEEEGLLDAAIAELMRRSEDDPGDVQAAEDLARAAVGAMGALPVGPRTVRLGDLADEAFRRGLDADPERDDLRLERARTLARMPSFLGRRSEAIRELETLVLRGETGGQAQPDTFSLLGTLLLEQGSSDEALATWQRGAATFPDNDALRRLLELHGGH